VFSRNSTAGHSIAQPILKVLEEFTACFQEPKGLPPHRAFDHNINLLPRVQSVNIKPYIYIPQQKDEIEKQFKEMIKHGIIKPNRGPLPPSVVSEDKLWKLASQY
jgi:hypothetical protein